MRKTWGRTDMQKGKTTEINLPMGWEFRITWKKGRQNGAFWFYPGWSYFFLVAVKVPFYGFRMRKNIESYLVIEEQIRMEQFGIVECLGQICVSPKGRLQNISGYLSQCSASHAAQQCSLMVRHSHLCFSLSPVPLVLSLAPLRSVLLHLPLRCL